jgi:ribosomal protein S28E/S33
MATSDVEICNLALARLGARSIVSLSEDSANARECKRAYSHALESELRAHPWSFARKRVQLAAASTDPAFGYAKQYPLPSDYLRILTHNGADGKASQEDFQIENSDSGRVILTNLTSPINLVYIAKITDATQFDLLFTELLVCRLAYDLCEPITQSRLKQEQFRTRYVAAQREARRINGFERGPLEPTQDPWVTARL